MEPVNLVPDWNKITMQLSTAPEKLAGIDKVELQKILAVVQEHWENIQFWPTSKEGVRHIRPFNEMTCPIEVHGNDIYVKTMKFATGSFKEVSLGVHLNTLKTVIIGTVKYVPMLSKGTQKVLATPDQVKAFTEKEIELMKLFQNDPRVVQLIHSCTYMSKAKGANLSVEKASITMEYCNGGELFYMINEIHFPPENKPPRPLTKEALLTLVLDMFMILETLEKRGVLHRDLKVENLILHNENEKLRLKLCDFGLSNTREKEKTRLAEPKPSIGGSPETFCPEVSSATKFLAKNNLLTADIIEQCCAHPVDTWAMGVALHYLITGEVPLFIEQEGGLPKTQEEVDESLHETLGPDGYFIDCLKDDDYTRQILCNFISLMLKLKPEERPTATNLTMALRNLFSLT